MRRFRLSPRISAQLSVVLGRLTARLRLPPRISAQLSVVSGRLMRLLNLPSRISTQLYAGLGASVALTVAASLVGLVLFQIVGSSQNRVNRGSVPEMSAAFGVAQYTSSLVAAAPRLTAATTPAELDNIGLNIAESHEAFLEEVTSLEEISSEVERVQDIQDQAETLILNVEKLKASMARLFLLNGQQDALRAELAMLNAQLEDIVVPAVDDQYFYAITGFRELDEPPVSYEEHFSANELRTYRTLAELQADANIATQLLASAFSLSDAALIEALRERFEAANGRMSRNLAALENAPEHGDLALILRRLSALGAGDQNGFDLVAEQFLLRDRQQELLDDNRGIAVTLVGEVDGLVGAANISIERATSASATAVFVGRIALVAISALSAAAALMISWLYVGRTLLRRLQLLADRMRGMAGGDLETQVEIGGRDEVADMAAALEVFRRHALEVQRLNMVERLANELQGKNDELESVLADLQKAQEQIVLREKLAALGELTAGVAHEIRNPLNFINNFSEVSEELLEELKEVLEEGEEGRLGEEQRGLVETISQDLRDNLDRIRSHGQRANRIVHDMLSMGRGSGESRPIDINNLVDEYANLAYHSARATDPEFQLTIERSFDPEVGELDVIPQDLGRVFLNIVGNACHATDSRRRANGDPGDYIPTVYLRTQRADDHVEVHIRDNGTGIPADVIDKVFNPFFTTKPTDQGTGLGLAISNDVIRQHGGSISVNSEMGEFTEMTVQLPLVPPAAAAEQPDDGDGDEAGADAGAEEATAVGGGSE